MKAFDQAMSDYQVKWREKYLATEEQGWQSRRQYPWILPQQPWEEVLWPGIRSDSEHSLPAYLRRNRIQKHQGVHNLKSSWMLCANLYFPFCASEHGRSLMGGFLREHVSAQIQSMEAGELEYAGIGDLHPSRLLGEQSGIWGAGQTSPDIAFLANGRRALILIENKLVEHSFYSCSARRHEGSTKREGNPDPSRCQNPATLIDNPASRCHQAAWSRRYWEHLAPIFNREMLPALKCCPAARAGYQLFRQQALAEGIAASGAYELVMSCVAFDARNAAIQSFLRRTGISDLRQWEQLFDGKASFAVFTHQQWVTWVRDHDTAGTWTDWLDYVARRYGYAA